MTEGASSLLLSLGSNPWAIAIAIIIANNCVLLPPLTTVSGEPNT